SYVPDFPGAMCIYGVTQIGTGSINASRYLPGLVKSLEVLKPALVFLSGAWFVLYLLNRQSRSAPLLRRVLVLLLAVGVVAMADATAEAAYLLIPKREEFLPSGCCTEAFDAESHASRFLAQSLFTAEVQPWLSAAYYGLNTSLVALLAAQYYRAPAPRP